MERGRDLAERSHRYWARNCVRPLADVPFCLGGPGGSDGRGQLDFPQFYGRNWDAFWDAVAGLVSIPDRVLFLGWAQLAASAPCGAAMLRRALDDYKAAYHQADQGFQFDLQPRRSVTRHES
ncbi:barstar family protein [Streptomyces sp. NPDC046716]|uniref:barstar family protein n=1 Tax=Streptomyces sp. NPDC046716 TaxID=3157093 RepID=UPI0033D9B8F4